MITVADVRRVALALPRAYEVLVRDQIKFRVGQIVFLSLSPDETVMGFGFPKGERAALVAGEPDKFMLPGQSDMRYNWVHVRLAAIDLDELRELIIESWRMCVPKKVAASRIPMDLAAYRERVRSEPCFICGIVAGHDSHEVFYDDGAHIAFLSKYPTVPGYALVAPRSHIEHAVAGFDLEAYLAIQAVIHRVARAVEAVVPSERTYVLSLGSKQGNAHVHWHVVPCPRGLPLEQQQFPVLMAEHGVLPWTRAQAYALAEKLRAQLPSTGSRTTMSQSM
ncbi:MmcQ/YjbR family DNA-binding protein [Allorhizocola rhizosphaerae]|uniref:MmcQ/YjbR family DNA-binding protein n=1 Tax=Allorhizocola rhizosphaerae TaxID=1872709 RepID=UPI000E3CA023|nr:MmcQ/YjbR family DNA-binding protein [Allorhizocola rhizosphaerae]